MNILLIFGPHRPDTYSFLSQDRENKYFILWNEVEEKKEFTLPSFIQKEFYWSDFTTPQELLTSLKPDRIVFCEIFDVREIPLCIVAKKKKIPTFFLDHGSGSFLDQTIIREKEIHRKNLHFKLFKLPGSIKHILKRRYFYYRAITDIRLKNALKFLFLPFYLSMYSSYKGLHLNFFPERIPHLFILYSRVNFPDYHHFYHMKEEQVLYSGLPNFDRLKEFDCKKGHMLYIDHPYLEEGMYSWNREHHMKIARCLEEFAIGHKTKLYIKLHPRSSLNIWREYCLDAEHIELLQVGNYEAIYRDSTLVLGFSSSILTGFLSAKKNVVLLGWHPKPQIRGFDFSKLHICHISLSIGDLKTKFQFWTDHNLTMENTDAYERFLYNYNYPFDGQAAKRIIEAITGLGNLSVSSE